MLSVAPNPHIPHHFNLPPLRTSIVNFVMPATTCNEQVPPSPDEETPLLSSELPPQKTTPVPWAQVSILLVLLLAEPLTSQVILPFTPEVCHIFYTSFISSRSSSTVRS
jgi:hypothetical protein